jgi:hypothetical protein
MNEVDIYAVGSPLMIAMRPWLTKLASRGSASLANAGKALSEATGKDVSIDTVIAGGSRC